MKQLRYTRLFFLVLFSWMSGYTLSAQSPDSQVCTCFTDPLPDDILATTGTFINNATRGTILSRSRDFTPPVNVPVRWELPRLAIRKNCGTVYRILILDAAGKTVYEAEDSKGVFSFTFTDCTKTYEVRFTATAKPATGTAGNCTRRLRYTVKPQCNTSVCNCGTESNSGISADLGIDGKVRCLPSSDTRRRYTIQYTIINKTTCNLLVESMTVLGVSIGGASTAIPAKASSPGYNMGFNTPLSTVPPAAGKVTVQIRYSLNGKKCAATLELPYEACR